MGTDTDEEARRFGYGDFHEIWLIYRKTVRFVIQITLRAPKLAQCGVAITLRKNQKIHVKTSA
jgi:hypothetical protein